MAACNKARSSAGPSLPASTAAARALCATASASGTSRRAARSDLLIEQSHRLPCDCHAAASSNRPFTGPPLCSSSSSTIGAQRLPALAVPTSSAASIWLPAASCTRQCRRSTVRGAALDQHGAWRRGQRRAEQPARRAAVVAMPIELRHVATGSPLREPRVPGDARCHHRRSSASASSAALRDAGAA